MNRVELRGGITRDVEIRAVGQRNTLLAEFTIAVNGARYDADKGEQVVTSLFVTVQAWGEVAEQIAQSGGLCKGDEVYVIGELDQREVEKRDGTKERKTRVTAFVVYATRRRQPVNSSRPSQATPGEQFVPQTGAQDADPWAN
jgi:single stranded DNA-binding protein